jgi:serine/threonine protein kinase
MGRDGKGKLHTRLGTQSYMAPEIHLGKPYTGQSVDLFAAAIILFIMMSQRPPFASANPKDPHYSLLAAGRSDLFWKAHNAADSGSSIYSTEFKSLFEQMTQLNPKHRLSVEQILAHPWMKGARATKEDIKKEFATRKLKVDEEINRDKDQKRTCRAEQTQANKGRIRVKRGEGADEEVFIEEEFEEVKL